MPESAPPLGTIDAPGEDLRDFVVRALDGDRDAAAEIYRRYHPTVLGIQLGNTGGDRQLASDLTQDTFVKALYRLDQFQWRGPASLRNWIAVIARNVFRDHVRSAGERHRGGDEIPEVADTDEATDPQAVADRDLAGNRELVIRVLERLNPDHQHVLRRLLGEGARAADVAAELGRTEAAVHQLRRRALEAARREMDVVKVTAQVRGP